MPMSADLEHRSATHRPWYRHGWVWFLAGIPASAIIAGSITIWIAVSTADSLVADDYYKEGLAIKAGRHGFVGRITCVLPVDHRRHALHDGHDDQ